MPRTKSSILATAALVLAASAVGAQESAVGAQKSAMGGADESAVHAHESAVHAHESAVDAHESIDAIVGADDPGLQDIEAQILAQEYDYPILWLQEQIDAVDRSSHRYDGELVRPLTLLGDAKAGKGDYPGALDDYQRAVHISRVNNGLNSDAQIDIVYREANIHRAMGAFPEANDREEYAYHVLTKIHEPYDAALLPAVYHLADWYGETHNIFSARALYERAVNILTANSLQGSPAAIPAYEGIARTYRLERFPPFYMSGEGESAGNSEFSPAYGDSISVNNFPAGERALQQIIQIHRNGDKVDTLKLAEAILDLADWYLLFDKIQRAFPLYEHVYALLAEADGFAVVEYFSEPKMLYFPTPQDPRAPPLTRRGERHEGFVEIAFEVSKTGYAKELRTVGADPEGLMDFRVRKSLRLSRYRPALLEGLPMDKIDQSYRHSFAYYPKLNEAETPESSDLSDASEISEGD